MRIPVYTRKKARIEIIPLIDIVFFLLATFVMVSMSMVKNQGISVNLPSTASGEKREAGEYVTITVTDKGNVFVNKELVSLAELKNKLQRMRQDEPDMKVIINGDEKADYGTAIRVLDDVRQLGIAKVGIQTSKKES
jgi:biopolymer transport protein ExbD